MPKMVCTKCQLPLFPKENGVYVAEVFLSPPQPCKVWMADLWGCCECGMEVVAGFGNNPIKEHYEEGFEELLGKVKGKVVYSYERAGDVPVEGEEEIGGA